VSSFNLVDEPWIPVRDLKGRLLELGIQDTLVRAKELVAIEDPSPLVVASLHRFLLAVLYRVLMGPTDIEKAKTLFRDGLPEERIRAYLKKWSDRFFLFDEKYPFGQIPSFKPETWKPWTVLAAEHNADTAKVLFDHIDVEAPGSIPAAACARWILATQTFSVSCGKSELSHTATAPSAGAAMAIPLGRNLLDTLLFSLVFQNREILAGDLPLWEREPETIKLLKAKHKENGKEKGPNRSALGWADRYTWRTRSICLMPGDDGLGRISRLAFASGIGFKEKETGSIDPMVAYKINKKGGLLPVEFSERGLWRDFDSLLPDQENLGPKVIENAIELSRLDQVRFPSSVMVLGQSNDQAKIEFWRIERYALPQALAGKRNVRSDIHGFLKVAEDVQKSLWSACRSFARDMLSRGKREPVPSDIRGLVGQMPSISWYWSVLEAQFQVVLQDFKSDHNFDEIEREWLVAVRDALREAWEQHRASVSLGNVWTIRALVKAEVHIDKKLKELNGLIANPKDVVT